MRTTLRRMERARAAWAAWSGPAPERTARGLTIAACATLFLNTVATLHVVYTLRVPYLLFMAAAGVGAPFVVRGWARAPAWVRWTAPAVLLAYAVATAAGDQQVLSNARAGSHRQLVYLADLVVGLAVIGLLLGLWPSARARWELVWAVAAGAAVAATYGIYQWFAQHYSLPLADLSHPLDSNGGAAHIEQGNGFLGWERIHGTFQEAHSFGAYLTVCLPLCALVASRARGHARIPLRVAVGLVAVAIVLTATAPAWATLAVSAAAGLALYAVARGWTGLAAVTGGVVVAACVIAPLVLARPGILAGLTNRSSSTLVSTTTFRTETWRNVRLIWARHPALGYGAGQSSVRLALQTEQDLGVPPSYGLPSAQGLWAASLLDAGVLGLEAWILFLGGVVTIVAAALVRRPNPLQLACFVALACAMISSQTGEDRLQLIAWTLLGLSLATALSEAAREHGAQGDR